MFNELSRVGSFFLFLLHPLLKTRIFVFLISCLFFLSFFSRIYLLSIYSTISPHLLISFPLFFLKFKSTTIFNQNWIYIFQTYLVLLGSSSNSINKLQPLIPQGSFSDINTISLATRCSRSAGSKTSVHDKCLLLAARNSLCRRADNASMVVSLLMVVVSVVMSACLLLCVADGGVRGVIQSGKLCKMEKKNFSFVCFSRFVGFLLSSFIKHKGPFTNYAGST